MYLNWVSVSQTVRHVQVLGLTDIASTNMTRAVCGIPEDKEADLTPALAGSLGMLALIMVILRWSQRIFVKKSLGWDDGLVVTGLCRSTQLFDISE
jgi:hypothetical protein